MKKIAKSVWQISVMPRKSINCYIVDNFLIDSGIRKSAKKILNSVKDMNIMAHVLTHAHVDHQGCSKEICENLNIPLWCSEPEKERAETGDMTKEFPFQNSIIIKFQRKFWAGEGCKVEQILKENDYFGEFKVIETPGHSSGHLSFFCESDGVLIVGDVATNMNLLTTVEGLHLPPNLFTKDREENIKSLKKLASLEPKILCFGHGPVLLNNNRQFEKFAQKF